MTLTKFEFRCNLKSIDKNKTTDFGFKSVPYKEKKKLVKKVFDDVAEKYDLMNDISSLGLHRLWKRRAVKLMNLTRGERVLDIASGTGDMANEISKKIGTNSFLVISDINERMLRIGRDKLIDSGVNALAINCNSESLPFSDSSFDKVSVAFGLRNMTDKEKALKEINRVLKVDGKLVVLEFSKVSKSFEFFYNWYLFNILPSLGSKLVGVRESYQYLVESIQKYPPPEKISSLMLDAGFLSARFQTMSLGIVSIHQAISGQ